MASTPPWAADRFSEGACSRNGLSFTPLRIAPSRRRLGSAHARRDAVNRKLEAHGEVLGGPGALPCVATLSMALPEVISQRSEAQDCITRTALSIAASCVAIRKA